MFTDFIVEHSIAPAVADHAGRLFPQMFPDSAIAKKNTLVQEQKPNT
jgi:hypothetical protein